MFCSARGLFRCFLLLTGINVALSADGDLNTLIDQVFGDLSTNNRPSNCNRIEGSAPGKCMECYTCDEEVIARHRRDGSEVKTLKLNTGACSNNIEVCCVDQDTIFRTRLGSGQCGKHNEDGAGARRLRDSVSALLEGEYPWMATIYKKSNGRLEKLCGATYIDNDQLALVTSARCVRGQEPSSLVVSFLDPRQIPQQSKTTAVEIIKVHENYNAASGLNDLALVFLHDKNGVPKWAAPACVLNATAPVAGSCVIASTQFTTINAVPLKRSGCENMHSTQLCAASPPGAPAPQTGAGLFCENWGESDFEYVLHGIFSDSLFGEAALYTQLVSYIDWINKNKY